MTNKLPEPPVPPIDGEDELAREEAQGYAEDNLEQKAAAADHKRSEFLKNHVAKAAVCVFWLAAGLFVVSLVLLAWNMLAPAKLCWMTSDNEAQLKALMGGIIASGGVQAYVKKYVA